MLSAYKRWISPALPNACRFVPTCSEYAMEAIERHGAVRGSLLAGWRLLRCHPFARGGYDPVPQRLVGTAIGMAFALLKIVARWRAKLNHEAGIAVRFRLPGFDPRRGVLSRP